MARCLPLSLLSILVAAAILGCGAPSYNYKAEPDPRGQEFRIGALDRLSVVVWENKEMSADVTVRPDGIVTLPLIGDVKAAGRTPSELQKEIKTRLGSFMRADEVVVSVGVAAVNSYHFTVMGAVERTGYYNARSYVTAVEAIAMAGGPNRFAGNELIILRGAPSRRIPINLTRAKSTEHANENLVILTGDVLFVP